MNRKQLSFLIVLLVVIGGAGFLISRKQSADWSSGQGRSGEKLLGDLPLNEVAHVLIQQPQGALNLVKDEIWKVQERQGYPANFANISEFLVKVSKLKPVRTLEVGPSQLGRLELLPPDQATNGATLVEFKDSSGKVLGSLLLGKKEMSASAAASASPFGGGGGWAVGRYLMAGDKKTVALVSEALNDAEAKAENWLDKSFFKVEKIRSIAVDKEEGSWKLARETEGGELKLVDVKEEEAFDSAKASGLSHLFSSLNFDDVVAPDTSTEVTGMEKPVVAKLETFDDWVYTVRIGNKTADEDYHVKFAVEANIPSERVPGADEKPEDKERLDKEFQEKTAKLKEKLEKEKSLENWTFLVSKWTVDPLMKERKDFMADKKAETPGDADGTDDHADHDHSGLMPTIPGFAPAQAKPAELPKPLQLPPLPEVNLPAGTPEAQPKAEPAEEQE